MLLTGFLLARCDDVAAREHLIVKMARVPAKGNSAVVEIGNPTRLRWCLVPVSFSTSQFQLLLNNRGVPNKTVNLNLSTRCLYIEPGESMHRMVDLSRAFTAEQLRLGKLCYTFSYGMDDPHSENLSELGTICEGRPGAQYLAPTFAVVVPDLENGFDPAIETKSPRSK